VTLPDATAVRGKEYKYFHNLRRQQNLTSSYGVENINRTQCFLKGNKLKSEYTSR